MYECKGFFCLVVGLCVCDFCCFSLIYWNISVLSFHWFPDLHFHQTMLVDCVVVLQQVKTNGGRKIFFRLEGTFPESPSERKIYLDYYLCICLKTDLEAALPSYPARLFFKKNVYFSLAYKYRESLSRLTTLRAQERPPIPEIFTKHTSQIFKSLFPPFFYHLIFHQTSPSFRICFGDPCMLNRGTVTTSLVFLLALCYYYIHIAITIAVK